VLRWVATAVAAVATGALIAWLVLTRPWETRRADSVAVLPFANLSADPANEYFSDGITEELMAALSRVDGLRVAARTSAFAFKGKNADLEEIRRRLGVATVLDGSVRRSGNQLRVTAQLVDTRDGYQLWSDAYDRDARDVFAVQQELSRAIAGALKGQLATGGATGSLREPDAEAYDLYLRGRHAWRLRTWEGLQKARDLFEQAIARDPGLARAHAGLADAYVVMALWNDVPSGQTYPRAKAAALQALALDSTLAEPHATLGDLHALFEWDWAASEREFRRSLALDPNAANTYHWYGGDFLTAVGRMDEAVRTTRRGRELDPLSPTINFGYGITLYRAGRYREALEQLQGARSLDPDFFLFNSGLGQVLLMEGKPADAVAMLERGVDPLVRHSADVALLGLAYARSGRGKEAGGLLRELRERGDTGYVSQASVALLLAGLGDTVGAFTALDRAAEARDPLLVYHFGSDPLMEGLRREPRGEALLRRMGLR
jgi:serine/threonine-protein kinase